MFVIGHLPVKRSCKSTLRKGATWKYMRWMLQGQSGTPKYLFPMNISFMEISLSMSIFHTTLNLSVGSFFGVLSPQEIGSSLLQAAKW